MVHFHTQSIDKILAFFETDREGLSIDEAEKRLTEYGANTLPSEPEKTIFEHFIFQFKSPIIYVLLIAAALALYIQEYTDAGFIFLVLLINAAIGTYQEYSASRKAQTLQSLIKTKAMVYRDGKPTEINSIEIVPGDIVSFESGTKIAADIRIIEAANLMVDESLLTGESVDVHKEADFVTEDDDLLLSERKNMLFGGTFVSSGRGIGVVCNTGEKSEAGKIATLLGQESEAKIPLIEKMEKLAYTISIVIGIMVIILFSIGLLKGMELYALFLFSVALAVSTIPEGLPVAITVALTSASMVMSKRNVIVRKLAAIEGLGSCTLIASDKTGTLTQNRLNVEYFISHKALTTQTPVTRYMTKSFWRRSCAMNSI